MPVEPAANNKYDLPVPPDKLWLRFPEDKGGGVIKNKTFSYSFRGEIFKEDSEIDQKVQSVIFYSCCIKLSGSCFVFSGYLWPWNIFQHHPAADNISRWLQFKKGKFLELSIFSTFNHLCELSLSGFIFQKYFFRNLGAILMYALVGTALSAFAIG